MKIVYLLLCFFASLTAFAQAPRLATALSLGWTQPAKPKVFLYADHASIEPGQAVTLTWRCVNGKMDYSNFGATSQVGTCKVSPRFSTTYRMQCDSYAGSAWQIVKVKVKRPLPRIALIGDPDHPDIPQIQVLFKGLAVVSVGSTIPPDSSGYDALIIHPSASIGPDDRPIIRQALDANKGVVVLGLAPSKLATGIEQFPRRAGRNLKVDTTAVAGWFGGVTELIQRNALMGDEYHTALNLDYFALPLGIDPGADVYDTRSDWDDPDLGYAPTGLVGGSCYKTIAGTNDRTLGFAFSAPTGRIYWQWHYQGRTASHVGAISALFVAGTLWAACP